MPGLWQARPTTTTSPPPPPTKKKAVCMSLVLASTVNSPSVGARVGPEVAGLAWLFVIYRLLHWLLYAINVPNLRTFAFMGGLQVQCVGVWVCEWLLEGCCAQRWSSGAVCVAWYSMCRQVAWTMVGSLKHCHSVIRMFHSYMAFN